MFPRVLWWEIYQSEVNFFKWHYVAFYSYYGSVHWNEDLSRDECQKVDPKESVIAIWTLETLNRARILYRSINIIEKKNWFQEIANTKNIWTVWTATYFHLAFFQEFPFMSRYFLEGLHFSCNVLLYIFYIGR